MPPGIFIEEWSSQIRILRQMSLARRSVTAMRRISLPRCSHGAANASRDSNERAHVLGPSHGVARQNNPCQPLELAAQDVLPHQQSSATRSPDGGGAGSIFLRKPAAHAQRLRNAG